MKQQRQLLYLLCRKQFGAFVHGAFEAVYPGRRLSPNWHIEVICHQIQQMVEGGAGTSWC